MKLLSTAIVALLPIFCYSQSTIFSASYPKGIVTDSFKVGQSSYKIRPIDNSNLEIVIRYKGSTDVSKPNEIKLIEKDADSNIVLSTDPRTGRVYYSDVVIFDGVSKKSLYKIYKQLPQGLILYNLISEDDKDFTFQKYQGSFQAKFAGDQYFIIYDIIIWFKDGRVKYEYSNFTTGFSENKSMPFGMTSVNLNHYKSLDQLYGRDSRYGDRRNYWIPVAARINESIEAIRTQGMKMNDEENW